MAKLLIPLGVVVGVICGFALVHKLKAQGSPLPLPARPIEQPAERLESKQPPKTQAAYTIYQEHLEKWSEMRFAIETTEGGWYQLGEMSSKGFVVGVSSQRAKIIQPDGTVGWIVATQNAGEGQAVADSRSKTRKTE